MFAAANAYLPVRKRDNNFHFTAQAYAASEADDDFRGRCAAAPRTRRRRICPPASTACTTRRAPSSPRRARERRAFPSATAPVPAPSAFPVAAAAAAVLVYTRALYEQPFLAPFVEWHARLGVGCFLCCTDSDPLLIHPTTEEAALAPPPGSFGDGRVLVHDVRTRAIACCGPSTSCARKRSTVGARHRRRRYLLLAPRAGGGIVDFIRQKEEEGKSARRRRWSLTPFNSHVSYIHIYISSSYLFLDTFHLHSLFVCPRF